MRKPRQKTLHPYLGELGAEIKRLRIQKKFSLEYLGGEIGLDASNYQKLEKGQNLTINTLLKLCICLGTTPAKLFDKIAWNLTQDDLDALTITKASVKKKAAKKVKK